MAFPATTRALLSSSIIQTTSSFNLNFTSLVNKSSYKEAIFLYIKMKQIGVNPDHLTFPLVLKAASKLSDFRLSQMIHTHVMKSPFRTDPFVNTSLINLFVKCGDLFIAEKLFEEMPVRDVTAWNAIILGYSEKGLVENVLILLRRMRLVNVCPDSVTAISMFQTCKSHEGFIFLGFFHCLGIKVGVMNDVCLLNTLISAYAKCEDFDSAKLVFGEIPNDSRTIVSWNSMISTCAHLGKKKELFNFMHSVNRSGIRLDLSTTLSLLSYFGQYELLLEGKMIQCFAMKEGLSSNISFTNTLISLYAKCGDVENAHYIFDNISDKTCVTWTVLIHGYAKLGDFEKAMSLFHAMERIGEKPDAATIVAILSACSQTGNIELGESMYRYAISNGLEANTVVCNALLDMYTKCGSMTNARILFDKMHSKNVVSWTTVIMGNALNCNLLEAFELFWKMLELKIKPNHVTFLGVLQACAHGGFLEKGVKYFGIMRKLFKIEPRLDHYACMVDLFGRKGKLKDALEFIKNMHIKPDACVWGALLNACIIHKDIEIGEYVASCLFEVEPRCAVSYVGISNIYASKKNWEDFSKIRASMKNEGICKFPGKSMIFVNGRNHAFTVEDRMHSEGLLIYEILDGLALQLRETKYIWTEIVT